MELDGSGMELGGSEDGSWVKSWFLDHKRREYRCLDYGVKLGRVG